MSSMKYWLWLSALRGLRAKTRSRLLEEFHSPEEIFFAGEEHYKKIEDIRETEVEALSNKSLFAATENLERCEEEQVRIVTLADAAFPQRLKNIQDPPVVLYVKGQLPDLDDEAAIAIVGTRKATPYGEKMAAKIGYEIIRCGGLVLSGLADGIDSAGAKGALRASGRVVGVLGTGIDQIYPRKNQGLYEDILRDGALVSEYPPGYPTQPGNFPQRNRLLSGLSVGVTVIEAPKKSGALITAARALEQGRDLFVVPGNADSPACEGSNELMRDCAMPVSTGWDILSEYRTRFPNRVHPERGKLDISEEKPAPAQPKNRETEGEDPRNFAKFREIPAKKEVDKPESREYIDLETRLGDLNEAQLKLVAVMTGEAAHVDDIIEKSGLSASTVLTELTMLELDGLVTREPGKRFKLNIISK